MAFDPKLLPPTVYDAYKLGPLAWALVVRTAVQLNITDISELTDMVFFLHHPELNGRPLKVGETELIAQWKGFRTLIKPLVQNDVLSGGLSPQHSSQLFNFQLDVLAETVQANKIYRFDTNGKVLVHTDGGNW